ncbi:MAG: prepilin peptidase [Acidimicrobiales bacterium]
MNVSATGHALDSGRWRAVTGLVLVLVEGALVWRFGWSLVLLAYLYFGAVLTVASVVDARTLKIPNVLLLPSYPLGVGFLAIAAAAGDEWWPLIRAVVAMAAVGAFYLALALGAGGQRFGLGDVKLGGLLGLLLGWVSWSAVSTGVVAGWVVALAVMLVWSGRPRRGRPAGWPAGPCLCLGALVALLATR